MTNRLIFLSEPLWGDDKNPVLRYNRGKTRKGMIFMHLDHEGVHSHTHTHDGVEHTHEHHHHHDHDHDHDHHHHDHGHDCAGSCASCGGCADPKEEIKALMKYMVNHNTAHANELAELAKKLGELGDRTACEQVLLAVSDFEKGNLRLSTVLAAMA